MRAELVEVMRSAISDSLIRHYEMAAAAAAALDAALTWLEEVTADWQLSVSPLAAGEVAALVSWLREEEE